MEMLIVDDRRVFAAASGGKTFSRFHMLFVCYEYVDENNNVEMLSL